MSDATQGRDVMPHEAIESLVIEALEKLAQGGKAVSPDTLIDELNAAGVAREAVIRAIWRLADLDEIDFREGRQLAIGGRAHKHANAA
jgi:hypothetical protein